MISPPWGFFALVSYVPDPLGSCLDGLTQSLPGMEFRQAHITILPPRPLRLPVENASAYTRQILDQFAPFEVELGTVRRFPATNVLYLDLTEGHEALHRIHDALNTGELAFEEQFEFHPHLTLAGPIADDNMNRVQLRAERLWRAVEPKERFAIREIVALWAEPGHKQLSWQRLWVHTLRADQSRSASVGITGQIS
jgi:2'-5' RNA ligase superfamily